MIFSPQGTQRRTQGAQGQLPELKYLLKKGHFTVSLVPFFFFLVVKKTMTENELAKIVFHLALKIHKTLGPGLLEKSYEECLSYELAQEGLKFERQKAMPLIYENVHLEAGYRVDFLIENKLIVEIKTVQSIDDVHISQTLTYLRLSTCKLALLINFNVVLLKNGVRRLILGQLINEQ